MLYVADHPEQPTPQAILDAVLHSQDLLAAGIGRLEIELGIVKSDVATLKTDVRTLQGDVYRLERRVIRIDDRLAGLENIDIGQRLDDHERRIARLEGF